MAVTKAQKQEEVAYLSNALSGAEIVVVAHNTGLNATASTAMRVEMRNAGVDCKVAKNTLIKIAAKGTAYEAIADMFKGPTIIAASKDPVAAAKAAAEFAKKNDKFVIVGGAMGSVVLDKAAVDQLSKLPSLDELRSKIVGLLVAAPTKLAGILQAPARELVGVTKAYGEKA